MANIKEIAEAGVDMFVAGSAIFNTDDYASTISGERDARAHTRPTDYTACHATVPLPHEPSRPCPPLSLLLSLTCHVSLPPDMRKELAEASV